MSHVHVKGFDVVLYHLSCLMWWNVLFEEPEEWFSRSSDILPAMSTATELIFIQSVYLYSELRTQNIYLLR